MAERRCRQQLNADVIRCHVAEGQPQLGIVVHVKPAQPQHIIRAGGRTHGGRAGADNHITGLMSRCAAGANTAARHSATLHFFIIIPFLYMVIVHLQYNHVG